MKIFVPEIGREIDITTEKYLYLLGFWFDKQLKERDSLPYIADAEEMLEEEMKKNG